MGFIALKCPSCGADITLDGDREFGFCQFCGTKIIQDKTVVEHRGRVSLDRSGEINNLLIRAQEMMQKEAFDEAENYYNRVLDIDVNNSIARQALEEIYQTVKAPNLTLSVTTGKMYNKKAKVRIFIDKEEVAIIQAGMTQSFKLSTGVHKVEAKIFQTLSKFPFEVIIIDRFSKFNYELKCKLGNSIEIIKK